MKLRDLTGWLDERLRISMFAGDSSNNGLQAEGRPEVSRAVFAVDASQQLFELAAGRGADFVFVHHGLSWGAEPRRLTGIDARRYGMLFRHGISLYAAHLPLDAAPEFGNNAVLSGMIGLLEIEPFFRYDGVHIGYVGRMPEPETPEALAHRFELALNCRPRILGDGNRRCRRVAVVSGGGGLGWLCYLLTVAVLALGHYASETTGPRALMAAVVKELDLAAEFIDLPTGL